MTLSNSPARSGPYLGNGTATTFDFTFPVLDAAHLAVWLTAADGTETRLSHPADFTAQNVGNAAGGTVTLITAPASGATVTILRDMPLEQQTDYVNQSAFLPETIERALDHLTMVQQAQAEQIRRAVTLPVGTNDDPANYKAEIDARAAEVATHAATAQSHRSAAETAANSASVAADNASAKAAEAAGSASSAGLDRGAAETARTGAETALNQLVAQYLGAKPANPATDNSGNALENGALYFNTAANELRAYNTADGIWYSATDAASSASAAASSATAAGLAQAQAEAARDQAVPAATSATARASDAHTSAVAAETAKDLAVPAATTATTRAQEAANSATAAETSANIAAAKATEAANSAGIAPALAGFVRASYAVATRVPAVVIDPVTETYFGNGAPMALADLVTHTRNSAAVFTDKAGQITSSPADTLRTDHHVFKNGVFQRAGLRVDQQGTNLLKYSEDFNSGPGWGFGSLASLTDVTAPDGNQTAKEITGISGSVSYLGQSVAVAPGFSTFSIFAKAGTDNIICLRAHGYDATPNNTVWFDVAAGAILTQSADIHTAEIQDTGDGWFRCSITFETTSDLVGFGYIYLCDGDGSLIAAGGSVLLWGAQAEAGGTPTSYIKTEAAQVTRAGDVITIPAANLLDVTNGMTVIFEGAVDWLDINTVDARLFHWRDTTPEIIVLALRQAGGHVASVAASGYKAGWSESGNATPPFDEFGKGLARPVKTALRLTQTEVQAVMNGTAYSAAALPNGMPDPSSVAADILQNFNGTLSRMRIFDTALPEAALIQETSL